MEYNLQKYHRRSIRLEGYDYSQNGAYFITICTQNKEYLFGEIINGENKLNDAGKMIVVEWQGLLKRFDNIELDEYIIMPNHFHGIIVIVGAPLVGAQNRATTRVAPTGAQPNGFGTQTAQMGAHNRAGTRPAPTIGNIIRDAKSLNKIQEYIIDNPKNWNQDELFV